MVKSPSTSILYLLVISFLISHCSGGKLKLTKSELTEEECGSVKSKKSLDLFKYAKKIDPNDKKVSADDVFRISSL